MANAYSVPKGPASQRVPPMILAPDARSPILGVRRRQAAHRDHQRDAAGVRQRRRADDEGQGGACDVGEHTGDAARVQPLGRMVACCSSQKLSRTRDSRRPRPSPRSAGWSNRCRRRAPARRRSARPMRSTAASAREVVALQPGRPQAPAVLHPAVPEDLVLTQPSIAVGPGASPKVVHKVDGIRCGNVLLGGVDHPATLERLLPAARAALRPVRLGTGRKPILPLSQRYSAHRARISPYTSCAPCWDVQ